MSAGFRGGGWFNPFPTIFFRSFQKHAKDCGPRFVPRNPCFMSPDIPAEKPPHEDRKVPRLLSQAGSTLMLLGVGWVLYLVYGARPLVAEPWQWADDGLYLRQAEAFGRWLSGEAPLWLGPYDPVLLSKAPLFGIWMGLLNSAGIPLRLAEFCQLLVLPWLFRAAVRPMWKLSGWQMLPIVVLLVGLPSCHKNSGCFGPPCTSRSPAAA